jgi:hypothetical protein
MNATAKKQWRLRCFKNPFPEGHPQSFPKCVSRSPEEHNRKGKVENVENRNHYRQLCYRDGKLQPSPRQQLRFGKLRAGPHPPIWKDDPENNDWLPSLDLA